MPPFLSHCLSVLNRSASACVVMTLLFALAAAELCVMLGIPLPWMIGPLLGTAMLSMLGAPTASWTPLRNAGQWIIGVALGLYFTPQVVTLIVSLWWAFVLNIVWALGLGLVFGAWLHRVHHGPGPFHVHELSRVTTYFSAPIGAASEMTLMGERHGAQTELVASSHSLRVLLVTVLIPFGFQWAGVQGLDTALPGTRLVHWPGLVLLAALTGMGCLAMVWCRRTNPWFIGALMVSLVVTACDVTLSGIPQTMINIAQLVIGISLGVRFTRSFLHLAPRWLASVALATLTMMVLSAGFAWLLAQLMPVHWATLLLGTAPGGIAEMAITAKVLQLGVPLVTALHVTRLAAVLLLVEPTYRWFFEDSEGDAR